MSDDDGGHAATGCLVMVLLLILLAVAMFGFGLARGGGW
jgi:hypothetical protein